MKRMVAAIVLVALLGCDDSTVAPQGATESGEQSSVNQRAATEAPFIPKPVVQLTEGAAAKVREKLPLADGERLLVGVAAGNSDYPQYDLRRASAEETNDFLRYESQGIPIATPKQDAAILEGMTVDWLQLESTGGFVFQYLNERGAATTSEGR